MTYHHADSPGLDPAAWRRGKELFAEHLVEPQRVGPAAATDGRARVAEVAGV